MLATPDLVQSVAACRITFRAPGEFSAPAPGMPRPRLTRGLILYKNTVSMEPLPWPLIPLAIPLPRFPSPATARVVPVGRVRELIRQVHFRLSTGKSDVQ